MTVVRRHINAPDMHDRTEKKGENQNKKTNIRRRLLILRITWMIAIILSLLSTRPTHRPRISIISIICSPYTQVYYFQLGSVPLRSQYPRRDFRAHLL